MFRRCGHFSHNLVLRPWLPVSPGLLHSGAMTSDPMLKGKHVRLEPLHSRHVDGLVAASAVDPSLYRWSPIPQGKAEAAQYVETAVAWRDAGTAVPFAIIRAQDDVVIGSTRFWNVERWAWPPG